MYKCLDCGHLFFEEDRRIIYERDPIDGRLYVDCCVCPMCGGDFEDATDCCECGEAFTEYELYDGWCEKCLRETINYDTFFEYCEANKDERYLDIFVMCDMLNCDEAPEFPSYEFHRIMIDHYKAVAKIVTDWEKQNGRQHPDAFLDRCIRFIMDDDGFIGRENYADWLNSKKEVK